MTLMAAKYRQQLRGARPHARLHAHRNNDRKRASALHYSLGLGKHDALRLGPGLSVGSMAFLDRQLEMLCPLSPLDLVAPRLCITEQKLSLGMCGAPRTVFYGWRVIGLINESHSFPSPSLIIRVTDTPAGPRRFRLMPIESR